MKERLDVLLVEHGYAENRTKARAIIMSGIVYVGGRKEEKAGSVFPVENLKLEVRGKTLNYVSRGGLKLEKALRVFPLTLDRKVCMDIGASTGGFTDCMLQKGALRVYAIDVGYGQLHYKLRQDERVVCMERTNFRYVILEEIGERVDFASVDVSFISLSKILKTAFPLLKEEGEMVCLIKPQFEAGKEKVGKKGVVRDISVHEEVIRNVLLYAKEAGFYPAGLHYSPIKGPEGNIEYLLYLTKRQPDQEAEILIREIVEAAAEELKG